MKYNKGFTFRISLIVAMGGFLLGFDSAVISGTVPFIREYFRMNDMQLGWAVSCLILGAMMGNLSAGPLSSHFGRKSILIITALLFVISSLGSALATSYAMLIIARILGGIGVGAAILIAPVYIAEIAPAHKRGQLVSLNQLNIVIGISAAYFSNYFLLETGGNNWRWMLGVEVIPALLYFIFLFRVPRSPRWLCKAGKNEEAFVTLRKIGNEVFAMETMREIRQSLESKAEKVQWNSLFSKRLRFIMLIGFAIAFFQQITGINAIMYYAPTIFEQAGGGTESSFLQAIIVGFTNLVFTILALYLIDRLGRKMLLMIGTALMAIALVSTSIAFYQAYYEIDEELVLVLQKEGVSSELIENISELNQRTYGSEKMMLNEFKALTGDDDIDELRPLIVKSTLRINAIIVLISILLFVAAFAISLGPVMWALLSEIFPNYIRGFAISVVGFFNSLVSFSVTLLFPWELSVIGSAGTFLIYGILAFLAFVFAVRYIPETKGVSLENLEKQLIRD
ncbi:MAG: sugar porter family MFS transporter [Bacteroidales bacterium]